MPILRVMIRLPTRSGGAQALMVPDEGPQIIARHNHLA
jgi:hypothetical protein